MPSPVAFPRVRFFDASGAPLALGWLTTYQAGTTTLHATTQDSAGLVPNTNPIQLDANGECLLWLGDTYAYDFALTDVNLVPQPAPGLNVQSTAKLIAAGNTTVTAAILAEFADRTDPALGAGLSGYGPGLAYSTDSVGSRINKSGHPSLTNVIISFGGADDHLLTGTVGYRNTITGVGAGAAVGSAVTAGGSNVWNGYCAGTVNTEGSGNFGGGAFAMPASVTGDHNNSIGYRTLDKHTNPLQINVVGFSGLFSLLTGSNITAMGESIFYSMTAGDGDCGFGAFAGYSRTTGGDAHDIGYQAGYSATTATGRTINGYRAAYAGNASYLTATGKQACENGGGDGTTADGFQAFRTAGSTATYNTGNGYQVGIRVTTGSNLTLSGNQSGSFITTGADIVCIGGTAGLGLATKSRSVVIGVGAQVTLDVTNAIVLGYNAQATGDNQVVLGDANISAIRAQVTSITALSDARFKKEIEALPLGLSFINEVRMVRFKWNGRDGTPQHDNYEAGVIAQELRDLQAKHGAEWLGLVDASNEDRLEATPMKLVFPLIRAVQELSAKVDQLQLAA